MMEMQKILNFSVSLKYLSNFWRMLDISLINSEVDLILTWSENCALTDTETRNADPNVDPHVEAINAPTGATFKRKDTKLYVPVGTS